MWILQVVDSEGKPPAKGVVPTWNAGWSLPRQRTDHGGKTYSIIVQM